VIRCGADGKLIEDFPLSQSLPPYNVSDAMFNSLNDFIIGNEIGRPLCRCQGGAGCSIVGEVQWSRCTYSSYRIDSASHTEGRRQLAPAPCEAVGAVNFIKGHPLNSRTSTSFVNRWAVHMKNFSPENGGCIFLRNFCTCPQVEAGFHNIIRNQRYLLPNLTSLFKFEYFSVIIHFKEASVSV
jgi:hypothetical protein